MIGIHDSIVHTPATANFSAFTYSQLVIGANTTTVVNGTAMTLAGGTTINLKIQSISGGTSVYLIGSPLNVSDCVNSNGTYSLP
jgi:hypothetical protein